MVCHTAPPIQYRAYVLPHREGIHTKLKFELVQAPYRPILRCTIPYQDIPRCTVPYQLFCTISIRYRYGTRSEIVDLALHTYIQTYITCIRPSKGYICITYYALGTPWFFWTGSLDPIPVQDSKGVALLNLSLFWLIVNHVNLKTEFVQ